MDKIKNILKKISNFIDKYVLLADVKDEELKDYILKEYSRVGIVSCGY